MIFVGVFSWWYAWCWYWYWMDQSIRLSFFSSIKINYCFIGK
jgi:hypothetical protein